jgi:hypothetical protein
MTKFDDELTKGHFVISYCNNCNRSVWPPSAYCDTCHEITSWKEGKKSGQIIEYSKKDDYYFCLIQTEDSIQILGRITDSTKPEIGQNVQLETCGFDKKPMFLFKLL